MNLIDAHCHLDDAQFARDLAAVIERATDAGVTAMITAGTDVESSRAAVRIAETYASVYAVVGIHPHHTANYSPSAMQEIRTLACHPRVVGIGEIGLDFHFADSAPRAEQEKSLGAQLDLAQELGLPVLIHDRDAHDALMGVLESRGGEPSIVKGGKLRGILHCFSGDRAMAERAIELGYLISFAGSLTFQNARRSQDLARVLPLEYIVVETDAPYLTPHPDRGKRNEPSQVGRVVQKIAALREQSVEKVEAALVQNCTAMFGLETEPVI